MMVRNASNKAVIVNVMHLSVVRLAAAVHETLSPFMTEIRQDLASVKEKVDSLSGDLKEHKSKTSTELVDMNSKLDSLDSKQGSLSMTVMTVKSELEHNILTNVTKELKKTAAYVLEQFPPYACGGTGGWRRVVYLNMTDPNTNCPSGWQLTSHSKRTCGKVNNTSRLACDSVFFPVSGGDYTHVCGSIRAYQHGLIDAFEAYHDGRATTVEEAYVSGVSLIHGSPRQHIWTFAGGYSEAKLDRDDVCPFDASITITIPPFVGGDYFCEPGVNSGSSSGFHPDDPLWDGEGCSSSSNCCSFNNPPYFTKQLPSPTSDPIEARLCRWEGHQDDTPVEFVELYVK